MIGLSTTPARAQRAEHAAEDLVELAAALVGSASGEHGIGLVKDGQLFRQWTPPGISMHGAM